MLWLKSRAYVYTGEPIPRLDTKDYAPFVLNYQKSILQALVKRNILTISQAERCLEKLEAKS
ncbi:MAG: hypothetical protein KIG43_04745 [Eubacteriales bacterium]|nr:hypothetical protein [Eubacteriales bacterium]MDD7550977.1 hypothetical protein [Clostridia bacterium]